MGVLSKFQQSLQKPEGMLGKMAVSGMNVGSAKCSDWGISHLEGISPRVIAELGCGGGRNAKQLLEHFRGSKLLGLDHSEVAVRKAESVNRQAIFEKRCKIIFGDVKDIPFKDEVADLATAFDTVIYWPGPAESFREVRRILKPGGIFLIVNSSDGIPVEEDVWSSEETAGYKEHELCAFLKEAGFSEIGIDHAQDLHWLCILCQK